MLNHEGIRRSGLRLGAPRPTKVGRHYELDSPARVACGLVGAGGGDVVETDRYGCIALIYTIGRDVNAFTEGLEHVQHMLQANLMWGLTFGAEFWKASRLPINSIRNKCLTDG